MRISKNKKLIRWIISAILAIDVVLVIVIWRIDASPRASRTELNLMRRQHALLAADIARAQQIRKDMPKIDQQGDQFFTQNLRPLGSAYSTVSADLGGLARQAGLNTENLVFRQHPADRRAVVEVEIGAVVNGNYSNVVRFIDALEHSDNFYVLEGLGLAAGSTGELKLNLQLRTYFRT